MVLFVIGLVAAGAVVGLRAAEVGAGDRPGIAAQPERGPALGRGERRQQWRERPDLKGERGDHRCLNCHGQPHIAELTPSERLAMVGEWLDEQNPPPEGWEDVDLGWELTGNEPQVRPELYVLRDHLVGSPHGETRCVDCHEDAMNLPHPVELNRATCARSCHTDQWEQYMAGEHNAALERDDSLAPTCTSCHGGHDMLRLDDRDAASHRLNSLFLCGECHSDHRMNRNGVDSVALVSNYLASAHAKAITEAGLLWAATCADCHSAHGVHKADDPRSTVNRANISETCGTCHLGITEIYEGSVHGRLVAEGDERAAVCTDCHTAHSITRANSPAFFLDIINECGECHEGHEGNNGRRATTYETYNKSYHGQVSSLGSTRAARCSDCHGAHDILPLDDPRSRVIGENNLIGTCGQQGCHPKANANFVKFDPHADYRDRKNYPVLYAVWWYFIIVMSSVFTFFGLHTLLWFARSLAHRIRCGPAPKHGHGTTAIRRFTWLNRINHALVVITFFGLTATGIPLVFAHQSWAALLAGMFGGIEAAGIWHRVFAAMLIVNFILHFYGLARAFRRRSGTVRQWLFGPGSLVPRWKDVTDCLGMFRWFFGGKRPPKFDRWTYWEKFDYWAEVGGSVIIGGTGLLLWFPQFMSKFVPGWSFNIAMVVHGYEALLAIGFIFTIHFFNAHIRPGKFPVDDVIFTGTLTEEEMKEERPEEYRRMVESGRLDSLRVKAPRRRHRVLWIVVAVISVSVGLTLLAFIILGGLSAL